MEENVVNKKLLSLSLLVTLLFVLLTLSISAQTIDWRQFEGETINLLMNKHTYTNSITEHTDEFTELTGIKVNLYALSEQQFFEKQKMVLGTGSDEYDITMIGPLFVWAYKNYLESLNPFIADPTLTEPTWDEDDFFQGLMASNSLGDELLAVPTMAEGYIFHYRKDLFDKYGLTVPTTMDEWIDTTIKLKEALDKDGKQDMDALALRGVRGPGTVLLVPLCLLHAAGGRDFDENLKCVMNSDISVKVHEDYIKLVKAGCSKDWSNYDWYDVKDAITSGRAASGGDCNFFAAEQWNSEDSKVVGKMAYALLPGVEVSNTWTWGLALAKESKHKKASWLFIQWATTKERLLDASLNYKNFDPTRKSVAENPQIVKMFAEMSNYQEIDNKMLAKAKVLPTPNPHIMGFCDMWAVALQEMWMGTKTVQEALDELCKKADSAHFFEE